MMKLVSCNARIEGCSAPFTSWIHAHRLDIERWFVKYVSTITVAADYLFESDHGLSQTSGALQDENRPLESWNMRCSSAWAACHSQSPREQFSRCLRQKTFCHSHIHIGGHTPVQSRHQIWHKRGGDVWAGALREHSKLAFMRPVFETALFCKCLRCQVLDSSLKQAQYLNDGGLVSLASRPQLVFKSGHQDAVHVFVISRSAELSGKKQFTFLGGRKKASTKTTSFWQIQTHIRESLFAGTRELEMFPQAH